MNASFKIIEQAVSERWVKPLALYHICKFRFGNSVVFNYQKRMNELSSKLGLSTKTLYNYLFILRENGLIEKKGNQEHLHLVSVTLLKYESNDYQKCKIEISCADNIHTTTVKLYGKLIENHIKKMAFAIAIKEFGRRNLHKMRAGETAAAPFSLSIRNISKLLNISKNTAVKVMKSLEDLKILKIYPQKPIRISKYKLDISIVEDYPGYKFITANGTFTQFGGRIELLQYPVEIPIISYRTYIKCYRSMQCKKYDNNKMRIYK